MFRPFPDGLWRGDRVADCAALEMLCTARYRGFESRPLRQKEELTFVGIKEVYFISHILVGNISRIY